jgi:NitT/TauT family transport system permease protein
LTGSIGILAPAGLIALLVGLWWVAATASGSVIIPTPWQVVLGLGELAQQGVLHQHVGSSLFRVTVG